MTIFSLPATAPRFARDVHHTTGGNANSRNESRAERKAAAGRVRDLVRQEAKLARRGDNPAELQRVRARISAYCLDYNGLEDLVAELRRGYGLPHSI